MAFSMKPGQLGRLLHQDERLLEDTCRMVDVPVLDEQLEGLRVGPSGRHALPQPVLGLRQPEEQGGQVGGPHSAPAELDGPAQVLMGILVPAHPQPAFARQPVVENRLVRMVRSRGVEVPRQHAGVLIQVVAVAMLEGCRSPQVERRLPGAGGLLPRHVLDKCVRESVPARFLGDLLDQAVRERFLEEPLDCRSLPAEASVEEGWTRTPGR